MNFLAHAYLSFADPDILAGNMISDFVKGKKQYDYSAGIRKGIVLHRSIDTFTDAHPATKEIISFFRPYYRLYAGPFTDIVYDYFLANDKNIFASDETLEEFTLQTYVSLQQNMHALPLSFAHVFTFMRRQNWLYNYRNTDGIMKSFNGLAGRAKFLTEGATAYSIFLKNLHLMQPFYNDFFPLLKTYAEKTLEELGNRD